MVPTVTLYTTPNCVQCLMTSKALDREDIAYQVVDLAEDETAMQMVKDLGYTSAPVVMVDEAGTQTHWSGFQPAKIKGLTLASSPKAPSATATRRAVPQPPAPAPRHLSY